VIRGVDRSGALSDPADADVSLEDGPDDPATLTLRVRLG
jgi:hypothetical protein